MSGDHLHSLKTYSIFVALSTLCIAVLIFLYSGSPHALSSQSISDVQVASSEVTIQDPIDTSTKRMRLTKILLRYQSQIVILRRDPHTENTESEITEIQEKIDHLIAAITELSGN